MTLRNAGAAGGVSTIAAHGMERAMRLGPGRKDVQRLKEVLEVSLGPLTSNRVPGSASRLPHQPTVGSHMAALVIAGVPSTRDRGMARVLARYR